MTWFDAAIIIMWVMGLIIVTGLYSKLEAKLDAVLNLVDSLRASPSLPSLARGDDPPPLPDKTVYHLTPEHDAKVLGDDDL